jgi:hypothetical protein
MRFCTRTATTSTARLAGLTCLITVIATFSQTTRLKADTQSGLSSPNPAALALANAQRAQEPKFRFVYCDDAEIDGLSEFMRFLLYANDKNALLADDPRPLWLVTGGGTNTICAALSQLAQQYQNTPRWDAIRKHVIANTHVYIILNQDNTFADYIKVYWPDLDVVLNRFQFAVLAYGWNDFTTTGEQPYLEAPLEAEIARGPMLGAYPLAANGSFLSEGDAPMYFQLLPTGLRSIENPTWGGWGGRFDQVIKNGWSDVPADFITPNDTFSDFPPKPPYVTDSGSGSTSPLVQEGYPLGRWIPAMQNDMLARSEWQFADYAHANHPPVVFIAKDQQNISAAPGQQVNLSGTAADPDGNQLSIEWWQYLEAGTYPKNVKIQNPNSLNAGLVMPADAVSGQTIHVILQATDDGQPPLTRYQRVIISCK